MTNLADLQTISRKRDLTLVFERRDGCVDPRRVDHESANEIPSPSHPSHAGLPLQRLAGVLARRLDPAPAVVPGDGRAGTKANCARPRGGSHEMITVDAAGMLLQSRT